MATYDYKVLGQGLCFDSSADIYTVPSGKQAIVSTIVVANIDSVANTYRLAVRPAGITGELFYYLAYDQEILANESYTWTIGATLDETDVVTAAAGDVGTDGVAFSVFGQEITP